MEAVSTFAAPFRRLLTRDDFRRNPTKALFKRAAWRLRWLVRSSPIQLQHTAGFSVVAPKGAAGALIYYLGSSEPETAAFLESILKPGMVVFDIGAHFGEYTLLASSRVAEQGGVHAFEAQPTTAALLRRNCEANQLRNATVNWCAISDREGEVEFDVCDEPTMSAIATSGRKAARHFRRIRVPSITLDGYCQQHSVWPDLLKIDVEGAELLVLRGAAGILQRSAPHAPALLFECLEDTYRQFGYGRHDVIGYLQSYGYEIFRLTENGQMIPHLTPVLGRPGYNLVALKS